MNLRELMLIRPLEERDHPFVFATWLKQLWYRPDNRTTLTKKSFMKIYHDQVAFLIRHHKGLVAALVEDPDTILGYLVDTQPEPFTYVRKAWRDVGVELTLKRENEE